MANGPRCPDLQAAVRSVVVAAPISHRVPTVSKAPRHIRRTFFRFAFATVSAIRWASRSRAVFPVWFEMGRTEAVRETGLSYRDLEEAGVFLVVVSLEIKYKAPARYDDVLQLETRLSRATNVRLDHQYTLRRDQLVITTASSTLACIDRGGKLRAIPPEVAQLDVG